MFYTPVADGYILRIRVTPNSSKCAIIGTFTDATGLCYLKISLTSVPEKGKANNELIKFLSKTLKLSKSSFTIISGETDRLKKINLQTIPNDNLEKELFNMETNQ